MRTLIILSLLNPLILHGSNLSWDRTEVKLEMEPEQKEIRASFKVTNEGEDRIRISRIKTSCGCTGSIIDPRNYVKKVLIDGEVVYDIETDRRRF